MDYGKAFRIIRAAFGFSQSEFSKLLGIGPSYMSLIESGKRQPSSKVIDALADSMLIPRPLIAVLAAEPGDLEEDSNQNVQDLAKALLKLLVNASGEQIQPSLPLWDSGEDDDR
jgi:transcriptional regulator with XRE-family HTH domain